MFIVVFCSSQRAIGAVFDRIFAGICDSVAFRTRYGRRTFEIDEKNIVIDIRLADKMKAAGLRPDYVLFYQYDRDLIEHWGYNMTDFAEHWEYNMRGRYTEIKSVQELIEMVIKEG